MDLIPKKPDQQEQRIEAEFYTMRNKAANDAYIQSEYPGEKFIENPTELQKANRYTKGLSIPKGVKIAESRIPVSSEQRETLRKELHQAEILTKAGNSVYLIPEHGPHGKKLVDAVVNGQLYEFKTVTGKVEKIERRFALAKEKGNDVNVFISAESKVSRDEARRRIAQVLSRHPDYTGKIIVSIPSGEAMYNVYFWDSKDLR